ncbi:MAG TPA: amidohydrolase [Verrucomicrobiae bacterium]|nr:amidohydrolase [Verrucomicrobiae bacterium]
MNANLIIINGIVRTMDDSEMTSEAGAVAGQAVAILGNRIVTIGSTDEIKALAGPRTQTIDAAGGLVLPGFNDAHVHFLMGGFQLSEVNLREAKSPKEFVTCLEQFVRNVPVGEWITGGEWDHEWWPGAPMPAKDWIDAVTPRHPVFLRRLDGHMALANSRALALANVTRATAEVPAGKIVRDQHGEPTGIFKDAAMDYVERLIPKPDFAQKLAAAKAASEYAASLGVTSVQDMSAAPDIGVYQTLMLRGELKTRIYGMTPLAEWEGLANTGIRAPFGSDLLRIGGLKAFSDGSLGSSTALFFEPYLHEPDNVGLPGPDNLPEGAMLQRVLAADRAGLQVLVHAIGDRANQQMLDIFKTVAAQNGPRDRRFRIEHAQHLRADEIPRFGRQHVVASMQPYHAIDDGRWCEARLGPDRCRGTYSFRSLLDANTILAFGSDWTIAPLDPLTGIYAAVTRRTLDGRNPDGWQPQEKISVAQTVRAYTVNSAYAEFAETVKGSIAPGKLADIVILDSDIFTMDPLNIMKARVLYTIMDGKVVFGR